ncbi:MAG: phthiodiolone/phenolphthiodiolone dimycocerosates ketoreductase [Thermoleophilaceae bacterium]|jgi:alkanesulfonate monooxygenase SsuD/methylene tetrahydromethanopterin reductase-like flavin-dependent oxidoreductase (luciferase family)|nr:phthiodiolone/phenolphthiodiolone dimycocerosates ketoreductase [Thermoleophilaceae bacterium]MEA2400703.1 phthiodiolone/phenolphthiodiolone dimycocerosates ketoreductase [Thermoleophilaceae bacterium]
MLSRAPSIGLLADVDPDFGPMDVVEIARAAEANGFEGAWMIELEYDSFAYDLLIAQGTTTLETGSCITRYFTRHPLLCAETAAVVDLVAPGRFHIGLGTGPMQRKSGVLTGDDARFAKQRWGLPSDREVARLAEYIKVVRLAMEERYLNFDGEFFQLRDVKLKIHPTSPPPIWISAGGDQMLRLAGRHADGVFTFLAGEEATHHIRAVTSAAAEKAGRDPGAVKLGNLILSCVSEDRERARMAMRAYLVDYYLHLPAVQDFVESMGFEEAAEIRKLAPAGDTKADVDTILADDRLGKAAELVSDRLLDELTIVGTPEDCRRQYEEVVSWGTDLPILYAFPADSDWAGGYRAMIEAFRFSPALEQAS